MCPTRRKIIIAISGDFNERSMEGLIEGFGVGSEMVGCLGIRLEVFLNFNGFRENIKSRRMDWKATLVGVEGAKDMSVCML